MPGAALLVGLHNDTDCLHAHALIFIPRRYANPYHPAGVSVTGSSYEPWLQARWPHGQVWAREFDRSLFTSHGPGEYLARDPGSVFLYGTPPLL